MRSILEKALVHLLNEENEQAEALFHKFMVQKARSIHESLRQGDDAVLESFDDINSDEMFTETDLTGLEDGEDFGGETASDETAVDGMAADVAADDVAGAELPGAEGAEVAGAEDTLSADLGAEGEGSDDDKFAELTAKIDELTAMFQAAVEGNDLGDETEADVTADETASDETDTDTETFGGEVDADETASDTEMAGDMSDDMQDGEVKESAEDEAKDVEADEDKDEFEDISESVVSELEKVLVSMTDGKEIGTGKSFSQNTKSPALQGKPDPMKGGKPVASKGGTHQGFERETAPSVAALPKAKNTKSSTTDGQSKVSKEGDKSALINKTPGAEAQTHSPLAKR